MRHEAILDLCCHFTPKYFFTQAYMDALIVSFYSREAYMDGWSEKQVVVLGRIMPGETVCSTRIRRVLRSAPELCRNSKGKGTIGRCSEEGRWWQFRWMMTCIGSETAGDARGSSKSGPCIRWGLRSAPSRPPPLRPPAVHNDRPPTVITASHRSTHNLGPGQGAGSSLTLLTTTLLGGNSIHPNCALRHFFVAVSLLSESRFYSNAKLIFLSGPLSGSQQFAEETHILHFNSYPITG